MSDDDADKLRATAAAVNDKLRVAAATVADVTAIKDRLADTLRARRAARLAGPDAALARALYGEQPKRTRKRKLTLAGAARQAKRAGIEASRYDLRPDGTISVVTGTPAETGDNAARTADDELTQWRKKRNAR